ncbi:DUF1074 domain-containing protein [Haloplanus salinus]|uniref:DUF1074 domain-containing protein n=1 Tax=Haloplanus salinus TaxID=1126245 RepID=A0A368N2G9_9EURY|nr:DUF1074 domain-containing protein [Haloplanus salinus]
MPTIFFATPTGMSAPTRSGQYATTSTAWKLRRTSVSPPNPLPSCRGTTSKSICGRSTTSKSTASPHQRLASGQFFARTKPMKFVRSFRSCATLSPRSMRSTASGSRRPFSMTPRPSGHSIRPIRRRGSRRPLTLL